MPASAGSVPAPPLPPPLHSSASFVSLLFIVVSRRNCHTLSHQSLFCMNHYFLYSLASQLYLILQASVQISFWRLSFNPKTRSTPSSLHIHNILYYFFRNQPHLWLCVQCLSSQLNYSFRKDISLINNIFIQFVYFYL